MKNEKKHLWIFDVDGTLLDTTYIGYNKINRNLERLQLPPVSQEFLRSHWGKTAQDLFQTVCDHVGANQEEFEDFCRHDKTMLAEYSLDHRLITALKYVKHYGIIIGILTSRTSESMARLAAAIGFDLQLFDFMQTKDHHDWHKPDGRVFDPLFDFKKAEGLNGGKISYFGDTISYDLAATLAAKEKIDFIAVTSGVNTREEFLECGVASYKIIDGCNMLPDYLYQKINYI